MFSSPTPPRHLSAIPPSVRCLPPSLQVIALCDMLADAREQRNDRNAVVRDLRRQLADAHKALAQMAESRGRFADWLCAEQVAHAETRKQLETISR